MELEYVEKLKELREDNDLLQKEVAAALGIKPQQYQRYESGETCMPIRILIALANLYKVPTDYILGMPKGRKWPR